MSTHTDLTDAIRRNEITVQQAILRIVHERDADTRDFDIPCEMCGKVHKFIDTHSPCLWMACPGHRDLTGFQLQENPGNPSGPPHQHFCCSMDCVKQMVQKCLTEHYYPEIERRVQNQAVVK